MTALGQIGAVLAEAVVRRVTCDCPLYFNVHRLGTVPAQWSSCSDHRS